MAISEDGSDYSYFATVDFGSNATPLWLLMDTGAANTWVMGADCTSSPCATHDTFGTANSSTLNTTSSTWTVTYGTGTVSGVVAQDTVSFAGFNLSLGFGLASNASDDFNSYPFDGILGLGRPDSDSIGTPTVMQTLNTSSQLKSPIIGINLQRNSDGARDGQITFGSTDSSKYTGTINYTPTVADTGLWEIATDGCSFGGNSTGLSNRTAIIDTGTSYILMPPSDATALHAQFPSYTQSGENYLIPCSSTKNVQFSFSGQSYDVPPKDYMGAKDSTDNTMCQSNIVGLQAFGADTWLMGDVFLKNVYTVFDFGAEQIGFAPAATTTSTPTPTPSIATAKTPLPASSSSSSTSASSTGKGGSSASATGSSTSGASGASSTGSKSSSGAASVKTGGAGMSSGAAAAVSSSLSLAFIWVSAVACLASVTVV